MHMSLSSRRLGHVSVGIGRFNEIVLSSIGYFVEFNQNSEIRFQREKKEDKKKIHAEQYKNKEI